MKSDLTEMPAQLWGEIYKFLKPGQVLDSLYVPSGCEFTARQRS